MWQGRSRGHLLQALPFAASPGSRFAEAEPLAAVFGLQGVNRKM